MVQNGQSPQKWSKLDEIGQTGQNCLKWSKLGKLARNDPKLLVDLDTNDQKNDQNWSKQPKMVPSGRFRLKW